MAERKLITGDNRRFLSETPDKAFDVAVIDPEYGIKAGEGIGRSNRKRFADNKKDWDNNGIPDENFFKEIMRVSTYQVIWGGNYFLDYLGATRCFFVWDKRNSGRDFADIEMAWTNFDSVARMFSYASYIDADEKFHPTQKPIPLYRWIYHQIDLILKPERALSILDTNSGSGTNMIAATMAGHSITAVEIDSDMVRQSEEFFQRKMKHANAFPVIGNKKEILPGLFDY